MPVVGGVAFGADRGNDVSRARQMAEYERMAERGLNVERQRNALLSSMNRMERERMQMAQRNFDSLRNSTNQMRQQNQSLRESYSLQGMQARSMERVADIHRGLTESLSLERMLTTALGAIWETQVARGAKLASKIIANIPNDTNRARGMVVALSSAFSDLSRETNSIAADYLENATELSDMQNQVLRRMQFTTEEIEAGANGTSLMLRNFNQSLGTLTRVGALLEDVQGTISFAEEMAQRGLSFNTTSRGLIVVDRMVRKLATDMHKGPVAELNNFDHILRQKVIKSVQELMTQFGGINASIERTAALITTAGRGAQSMGATMQEAAGIQGAVGNLFMNTHGAGEDISFMAGELFRNRTGLRRQRGPGGRLESVDDAVNRVMSSEQGRSLYGSDVSDDQRRQRLRLELDSDQGGQQMTANLMAMEEHGQTAEGMRARIDTINRLHSGASRETRTELLGALPGMTGLSRMQLRMMMDMAERGDFSNMAEQANTATRQAGLDEATRDPTRQAQAILDTSRGIGELVKIQNMAGKSLQDNIDRIVQNVARLGAGMVPGGIFMNMYNYMTRDDPRAPRVTTQAEVNAAASDSGGPAGTAGRVIAGSVDERTGHANVVSGRQEAIAGIDFASTLNSNIRDRARANSTAAGEVGEALGPMQALRGIQDDWNSGHRGWAVAQSLARLNPVGAALTTVGGLLQAGDAAQSNARAVGGGYSEAFQRSVTQTVSQFQETFGEDAALRLQRELQGVTTGGEADRIVRAARDREQQRMDSTRAPTAPATPGNAPAPSATPSAQGAAGAVTAPQAARQNTAAGQTPGVATRGNIAATPAGGIEITIPAQKLVFPQAANAMASINAGTQAATAQT